MARIHPTAVVDPAAKLADDVVVGPFAVIDRDVELALHVDVGARVTLTGRTTVGTGTRIYPGAVLGTDPQIVGLEENGGRLEIGSRNVIREFVTIHVGSTRGEGCTRIGDDNYLLNNVHIAHDDQIGSHCVLASFTALGGHVVVEDHVVFGAMTGVHQFVRLGESAFTAANAMVTKDVLPFSKIAGDRAKFAGMNSVGLARREFSPEVVASLRRAFHLIFLSKLRLEPALARVEAECEPCPELTRLLAFARSAERGLVR